MDKQEMPLLKTENLEQLKKRLYGCLNSPCYCLGCKELGEEKDGKCPGLIQGIVDPCLELISILLKEIKEGQEEGLHAPTDRELARALEAGTDLHNI